MTSPSNAAVKEAALPFIKDVNVQNFTQEVIQASLQVPVLVYFTASWCGPCKQYGPLLEKVVSAAKGRVKLVRVDIDKSPQLAQQFRIQSVPMVYVFLQGQPLDGFAGAMPESQLKQLIEQVAGANPEAELVQATLQQADAFFAQGNVDDAEQAYSAIAADDPENVDAVAGLVKCHAALDAFDKAEAELAKLPPEKHSSESIIAAKAALTLAKSAPKAANLNVLQNAVTADPQNHQARFDYAVALFAAAKQEQGVNELLEIIAKNKTWNEGAAHARLLTFFEALGFSHPVAVQGRRKLSSILFA